MAHFEWEDVELVSEADAEKGEFSGLMFMLPKSNPDDFDGVDEVNDDYMVQVWHVKLGLLGSVSMKTLGRVLGRAKHYAGYDWVER